MATISRANNGSAQNSSRRAYIATTVFYNEFFSYRTYLDADRITQGELDLVTTDPADTPKARILRETGKKLFPNGVNPGVETLLVGVYDSATFLNGYIDPNSPVFAVYSTDLPNFLDNGEDPAIGGLPDRGPPVITNGLVEALSSITTTAGNLNATLGGATTQSTITTLGGDLTAPAGSLIVRNDISGAHLYVSSFGSSSGVTSPAAAVGATSGFVTLNGAGEATVNTTAVHSNSIILFTCRNMNSGTLGVFYTNGVTNGTSFNIKSTQSGDRSIVQWFIVN